MNNYQHYFLMVAENEHFIVINKQAGINFHSEDGEFGVVVAAEKHFNIKLYSVHRLDKMTSGLLLLAKSSEVAHALSLIFQSHDIEKFYLAISDKKPKKKQGLIKGGMEKSRRAMWKLTNQQDKFSNHTIF